MSFPRYPKYKESGIEGLGAVPAHWQVTKMKWVAKMDSGHTPDKKVPEYWEGGEIPWVSLNDTGYLKDHDFIGDTAYQVTEAGIANSSAHLLPARAVVFSRDATIGRCAITTRPMAVSQHFIAWVCGPLLMPEFLLLRLRSMTEELDRLTTGATIKTIGMPEVRTICTPLPPKTEQQVIVEWVADQCHALDALANEQERLIELLKEKRQAVISHAVTKGVNPNAPMKDSGTEWLGQVPAHWGVVPLKKVAGVSTGVAKGKNLMGQPTISVPYLRVANVQDGYLDLADVAKIDILPDELERYALRPGDVLMNEGGDFDKLGRGCVWDGQISPCITQNHVFAVRPAMVSPDWLSAIIGSRYAQFFFMSRSKQSTNLASISSRNLIELPVVLPPAPEQVGILEFVAKEQSASDALVVEAERAVGLLQERRAALISAAVTGQIDVRPESMRTAA